MLFEAAVELCLLQAKLGGSFVLEHPKSSTAWSLPAVARLMEVPGLQSQTFHVCCYGLKARDKFGEDWVNKPTMIMTNSEAIAQKASARCTGGHRHVHLIGGKAKAAAIYPVKLVDTFLDGLMLERAWKEEQQRPGLNALSNPVDMCDPEDIPNESMPGEWYDDGEAQEPGEMVLRSRARQSEMATFEEVGVYEYAHVSEMEPDSKLIDTTWVEVNKGSHALPDWRARLCAREFNNGGDVNDLFAPTPPLWAVKMLLSWCSTRVLHGHDKEEEEEPKDEEKEEKVDEKVTEKDEEKEDPVQGSAPGSLPGTDEPAKAKPWAKSWGAAAAGSAISCPVSVEDVPRRKKRPAMARVKRQSWIPFSPCDCSFGAHCAAHNFDSQKGTSPPGKCSFESASTSCGEGSASGTASQKGTSPQEKCSFAPASTLCGEGNASGIASSAAGVETGRVKNQTKEYERKVEMLRMEAIGQKLLNVMTPKKAEETPAAGLMPLAQQSTTDRNGWTKIRSVVDTGAFHLVLRTSDVANYPIRPSQMSQAGEVYTTASGHEVANEGQVQMPTVSSEGIVKEQGWQIAEVTKNLLSVMEEADRNQYAIFGKTGGILLDTDTGEMRHFAREPEGYVLEQWVPPSSVFTGRG